MWTDRLILCTGSLSSSQFFFIDVSQIQGWTVKLRRSTLQVDAEEARSIFNMRGTSILCLSHLTQSSGWMGKYGLRCCTAEGIGKPRKFLPSQRKRRQFMEHSLFSKAVFQCELIQERTSTMPGEGLQDSSYRTHSSTTISM